MDSPRSRWDDDALDRKFAELELRQGRLKRALRNRPTRREINLRFDQVMQRFDQLTGSATNTQIIVAAIGAAALVAAALISGVVDLHNATPAPTR